MAPSYKLFISSLWNISQLVQKYKGVHCVAQNLFKGIHLEHIYSVQKLSKLSITKQIVPSRAPLQSHGGWVSAIYISVHMLQSSCKNICYVHLHLRMLSFKEYHVWDNFFKLGKTFTKNYEMLQKVFDFFMNCMMTNKWDRGFKGCTTLIKDNLHSGQPSTSTDNDSIEWVSGDNKHRRKQQMTVEYK